MLTTIFPERVVRDSETSEHPLFKENASFYMLMRRKRRYGCAKLLKKNCKQWSLATQSLKKHRQLGCETKPDWRWLRRINCNVWSPRDLLVVRLFPYPSLCWLLGREKLTLKQRCNAMRYEEYLHE